VDNAILYTEAQEAIALRDEFFSIASHELKTPISSLSLHLQLMRRMIRRSESVEDLQHVLGNKMKDLESQLKRITGLIENLLDVSRLRSGKISLEPEKFNFADLVRDLVDRLQPMARHRGIRIDCADLCAATGFWDRFRMEQVMNNLITNAIKYGDSKPVRITSKIANDLLEIHVIDQGKGVPEADREKIFDRFERSAHTSQVSGLGLGLYIVHQFVKSHGGSVKVVSEVNEGSVFVVLLPIPQTPDFYLNTRGSDNEFHSEQEGMANSTY
jgi:signal transduction histidine kinase